MKNLTYIILLFTSAVMVGQAKLEKADKLFKALAYMEASKAYDEYLEDVKNPSAQILKNAGDSYYLIDDNRNALKWYQKLYEIKGTEMTDQYFLRYIQSLKGVMDYDRANQLTRKYLEHKGDQKQIDRYVYQYKYNDSLNKTKPLYTIKNLEINTPFSEFGTAFYGNNLIFASTRSSSKSNEDLYNWNKQPFLNLYTGERNLVTGEIFNESVFLKNVMSKFHEATATFSPDLKTIYYTTNIVLNKKLSLDESRTNNFQIIKGQIEDGKLLNPENLFFNSKNYSNGHPSLSDDGKWLFFASDMPGGFGETDLYVLKIADDGTMGTPKNLGPTINTIGNELFPFFKNGILYFSSDGHYGYGDLDVYESNFLTTGEFSTPHNLGLPINSNKDDFAFIFNPTTLTGYFSSNRALGKGDDDIYYFTKSKPDCNEIISGTITNKKSNQIIANATISAFDAFDVLILNATSDENGKYNFTIPCDQNIKIVASKANHSSETKVVKTQNIPNLEIKETNFELSNYDDLVVKENGIEKVSINPIFFEYDKSNITSQAATELNKVIFIMEKFPNIEIKIESHTDSRGKDEYNLKLSDDRAKSTQTYLTVNGIAADRIESAVGYGETRLINTCSNGINCSEEEHFKNRRSEFIIIKK